MKTCYLLERTTRESILLGRACSSYKHVARVAAGADFVVENVYLITPIQQYWLAVRLFLFAHTFRLTWTVTDQLAMSISNLHVENRVSVDRSTDMHQVCILFWLQSLCPFAKPQSFESVRCV